MDRVIGIGEYAISNNENDKIRTFALGSCVAVTVYCPGRKVMGMVHIALPKSEIQPEKVSELPGYFADTGVPLVINKICTEYGCSKDSLVVKLYGGASSIRQFDIFNIGRKNVQAVKKILAANNIQLSHDDTGGSVSRTLEADVSTGDVKVDTQPLLL